MIILKKFIREFLSFFVFLRFKNFWHLYDYLYKHKKLSGINASCYTQYCEDHSCYIGIGASFGNHPYLPHGLNGIFIADNAVIGKNCIIYQQVTIGATRQIGGKRNGSPTIGDNCYIGTGAKIIGKIKVGNNVRIGANAVVYEDIPDNSVVVPSKTRVITKEETLDNRFIKMGNNGKECYYDFESESFKELEDK